MPAPSILDRIVGHPLVLLAFLLLTGTLGMEYWQGRDDQLGSAIISAIMLLWGNAANQRVASYKAYKREWEAMGGNGAPPGGERRIVGLLDWPFMLLRYGIIAGLLYATSPIWLDWILRFLAPFGITVPDSDDIARYIHRLPSLPSVPSLPSAPDMTGAGKVTQKWAKTHTSELFGVGLLVLLGFYIRQLVKGWRRWRRGPIAVAAPKKWDGTVQVMLPVPKR